MIPLRKSLVGYKDLFSSSGPFNHVVIDDFLDLDFARDLSTFFPSERDVTWWAYDNPLEMKLAFDKIDELHPIYRSFFEFANSQEFLVQLREVLKILFPIQIYAAADFT